MSQIIYILCDMNNNYMNTIRKQIEESPCGTIFSYSDFSDLGIKDSATIRQSINRLVKEKTLRKIKNGIFEKPIFSKLLNQELPPNPEKVAEKIAKNFHWNIVPCGDVALNKLGLSTQIPANWTYLSDGPYKEYEFENFKIAFKHRTNREISGMSNITVLLIQALKTLEKENVDENTIKILKSKLNAEDKKKILRESTEASDWIKKIIYKICED